jgi:hypothetical protein
VALARAAGSCGQDRHHRHVLVSKGLLPEATAKAAALPEGKRWCRNLPSTAT